MIKLFFLFNTLLALTYLISLVGYLVMTTMRKGKLTGIDWFQALIPVWNVYAFYRRAKEL